MKNIEQFYIELKNNFKKIDELELWNEFDWSENGYENSFIMTKLAQEISSWNLITENYELSKFLKIIEDGFIYYNKATSSMLATDFLVTIMEIEDQEVRNEIKQIMLPKTQLNYQNMLTFYRES